MAWLFEFVSYSLFICVCSIWFEQQDLKSENIFLVELATTRDGKQINQIFVEFFIGAIVVIVSFLSFFLFCACLI